MWNDLPDFLALEHDVAAFKNNLKTYLFCIAFWNLNHLSVLEAVENNHHHHHHSLFYPFTMPCGRSAKCFFHFILHHSYRNPIVAIKVLLAILLCLASLAICFILSLPWFDICQHDWEAMVKIVWQTYCKEKNKIWLQRFENSDDYVSRKVVTHRMNRQNFICET